MIVHNFSPTLIDLGFFQIKWYSAAYIFGIIFGWLYARKIIEHTAKKNGVTLIEKKQFDDLISYLIIGIIVGGRLGYVFFYDLKYFILYPVEILMLWKGGMSFHGGLIGVIVYILVFSRISKINFFILSDLVSCVAPIGIFLGRIANFINGELYGKISNAPWAVIFPNGGDLGRHPSQIYEAVLEGVVLFIILNYLALKKGLILKIGSISSIFLIFYSILRIISESFREPDQHIGYLFNYFSMGTLLSVITFATGILIIIFKKKNE